MHDNWIKQEQQRRHRAYHFLFVSFVFFAFAISLFVMMFVIPIFARAAGSETFSWLPNNEPDLAGYEIHWGAQSGTYTKKFDCGLPETNADGRVYCTIENTPDENTFYAAVAYDAADNKSDFSNEVDNDSPPDAPGSLRKEVTVNVNVTVN